MSYDLVNRRDLVTGHHTSVNGTKASIQAYLDIGCDAQKLNLGYAFYAKYFTTSGDCSSQPLGCAIVAAEDPTTGKDTMTSGAWTFEKAHMQPFDESAITPATDGKCGPDSMTKCPAGNCCSVDGWCGATPEHCGGACQHAFGEGCTGPDVYASWQKAAVAGMTDDTAGGEYFFDAESKLFWTWDTVELMQKKISDIVNPMHVGGVMAWSLGEDSDGWKHIKAISEWVKQPGGNNMTSTPSGTPENVGGEQVSVVTVTKTVTATAYAAPSA
jgi:chitinase